MINYAPESEHAQEMAKWEMRPTREVPQDMIDAARRAGTHHGAFDHHEYPKAMYIADQTPNGIKLRDERMTAHSITEEQNLKSRGYRVTAQEAFDAVDRSNFDLAVAAAERNYHEKGMSEKARKEADKADRATAAHVGEVPVTPIPPRRKKVTYA